MKYLEEIDITSPGFGDLFDELTLWSAPFGRMMLDRIPIKPGLTILDVGAGTGFLTIELAERCGPSATVIAVDPWKTATERLRRKIDQWGLDNVVVLEQDAIEMDLPDGSVDVIASNLGINNFDDPSSVLQECYRVAKPGAALLLTTNLVGHMAEFYEVYRKVLIDTGQSDRLEALQTHIDHRGTVESVTGLLGDAGFQVNDVFTDSFKNRYADGSALLGTTLVRLGFVQAWKAVAAQSKIHETFERLEQELNRVAAAQGELSFTIPTACFAAEKVPASS